MSMLLRPAEVVANCRPGTVVHMLTMHGGIPTVNQIGVLLSAETVPLAGEDGFKITTLVFNHSGANPGPMICKDVFRASDTAAGLYVLTIDDRERLARILADPNGYITENFALCAESGTKN